MAGGPGCPVEVQLRSLECPSNYSEELNQQGFSLSLLLVFYNEVFLPMAEI